MFANMEVYIVLLDSLQYNIYIEFGNQHAACEVTSVGACYKKLWKLLIDRDMKKRDLCSLAHVSPTSLAKLSKGENVNTDILVRICRALGCDIGDVMEVMPDTNDII